MSSRRYLFTRLAPLIFFYLLGWGILRHLPQGSQLVAELSCLILLLLLWTYFFAQFVLPVQGFASRWRIFVRLFLYSIGIHGPIIFVENGHPIERMEEEKRRGPGVLWLDSASGGVLRNQVRFTRVIGPGVHFTASGEYPAGFVDLHVQTHTIGPGAEENPFNTDDETIQRKRYATSALTRDGIEVVPTITVIFKIDAEPARGRRPGSRFGYHPESVLRAIRGEGIEVQTRSEGPQRVRWNQLPALLAADLWREYLSKFTFDQLFQVESRTIPEPPAPPPPRPDRTTALYRPIHVSLQRRGFSGLLAELLHEINRLLERLLARYLEPLKPEGSEDTVIAFSPPSPPQPRNETALQLISRMVLWRMQSPEVPELDAHGNYTGKMQPSREFQILQEHGLRIRAVNINNLRFPPGVEDTLLQHWTATWLKRARQERDHIEQQRTLRQIRGQETALKEYALRLSHALSRPTDREQRPDENEILRRLLHRSRRELNRDVYLQQRATNEINNLDEILQWLESNR